MKQLTDEQVIECLKELRDNVDKTISGEYPLEDALPDLVIYVRLLDQHHANFEMTPAITYPERTLGAVDTLLELAEDEIPAVELDKTLLLIAQARLEIQSLAGLLERNRPRYGEIEGNE